MDDCVLIGNFRYLKLYDSISEVIKDENIEDDSFVLAKNNETVYLLQIATKAASTSWKADNGLYINQISLEKSASDFYTNLNKVPNDIGGIHKGSTFDKVSFQTMFDSLLYPTIGDEFKIQTNLSSLIFMNGEKVNLTYIRVYDFLCPGLTAIRLQIGEETTYYEVSSDITEYTINLKKVIETNTDITISLIGDVTYSNKISIGFTSIIYYGVVNNDINLDNEFNIRRLNKSIVTDSITRNFTTDGTCVLFAVPLSLNYKGIYDLGGNDVTDNFSIYDTTLHVTEDPENYRVYKSNVFTLSNISLTIKR